MLLRPHFTAVIAALCAVFAGCGKKDEVEKVEAPPPEPEVPRIVVAVVSGGMGKVMEASFKSAAEGEKNVDLIFESMASNDEARRVQIGLLVEKGAVAVAFGFANREAISQGVQEANSLGVPAFVFGTDEGGYSGEIVSQIGPDSFERGVLAGKTMIEATGETGAQLVVLKGEQSTAMAERLRGFHDTVERFNQSRIEQTIEVIERKRVEGITGEFAKIDGIFAMGKGPVLDVLEVVERHGKQDRIALIGIDGGADAMAQSLSGRVYGVITVSKEVLTRETMSVITRHLAGDSVPNRVVIPSVLK